MVLAKERRWNFRGKNDAKRQRKALHPDHIDTCIDVLKFNLNVLSREFENLVDCCCLFGAF